MKIVASIEPPLRGRTAVSENAPSSGAWVRRGWNQLRRR